MQITGGPYSGYEVLSAIHLLGERERQVLELVVEGLTNAEIATQLYLSENTVKKYLRNWTSPASVDR